MPNTVVKLINAESTWPEAAREDRKLLIKRISRESVRFFYSAYSKIIPLRGMARLRSGAPACAGGRCAFIPLRGMARLRRAVFISFFSEKERNEPKKETADRNKFACAPGAWVRQDASERPCACRAIHSPSANFAQPVLLTMLSLKRGRCKCSVIIRYRAYGGAPECREKAEKNRKPTRFMSRPFYNRSRASGASDYNRNCRRRRHLLKPSAVSCRP